MFESIVFWKSSQEIIRIIGYFAHKQLPLAAQCFASLLYNISKDLLAYWSSDVTMNVALSLQVAIVVSGEMSLLARQPSKRSSQHVLDLLPFDMITAGPLLEVPELCTVVAKVEAEVLLIGRNAFEEHLGEVCCPQTEKCCTCSHQALMRERPSPAIQGRR
jgi:hypothetical protein